MTSSSDRVNKLAAHLMAPAAAPSSHLSAQPTSGEQQAVWGKLGVKSDDDVVVVSAKRTAITRARKGAFKDTTPDTLLTAVFKGVLADSKVDPKLIDDICVGNVQQSGSYILPARPAAILAGIPDSTAIRCVNRQCASGMQAVADIASNIRAGFIDVGMAAGVESMSLGGNPGDPSSLPPMNMNDIFANKLAADTLTPMGITSENIAKEFGISREEQDAVAVASHEKALRAQKEGWFKNEIVPVTVTVEDADGNEKEVVVDQDEGPRAGTTMEGLGKLKPAFAKGGSTTAGNSSQVSDGAAAVLLTSRRKAMELGLPIKGVFRGFKAVGVAPATMGTGPVPSTRALLEATGVKAEDVDVFEANEAFGTVAAYFARELKIPAEKLNPNGGAISLGHPLGCTGARMMATILNTLERQNKKVGVTCLCVGGGQGCALLVEKE